MILIITPDNHARYKAYLDEMYRVRYEVFVDRCGWKKLANSQKRDIDEFDQSWVTYYLKLSPEGKILAGLRTLPTNHPYMIEQVYYPMFGNRFNSKSLPNDPRVWEMSRYFVVDPDYRTESGHAAKMELYVAVFEHALASGVKSLCAVGETYIMSRAMRLGWKIRPISVPFVHSEVDFEGEMLAIDLQVNEQMVAQTRSAWNLTHAVRHNPENVETTIDHEIATDEVSAFYELLNDNRSKAARLLALMHDLASKDDARREQAEKFLDSWLAKEVAAVGASAPKANVTTEKGLN